MRPRPGRKGRCRSLRLGGTGRRVRGVVAAGGLPLAAGHPTAVPAETAFVCEVDGYEADNAHIERTDGLDTYAGNYGILHFGTREVHDRMAAATRALDLRDDRPVIVVGNFETGEVYPHTCPGSVCTMRDDAVAMAVRARGSGSRRCLPFAIRVGDGLFCVAAPGLDAR